MAKPQTSNLRGCPRCGLVQQLPDVPDGQQAVCQRCGDVLLRPGAKSNRLCTAIALSALILYPLGIFLPVMRLEQLGHVRDASIWHGTISMLKHGQYVIGFIVLFCSVVIPVMKLAGLLMLCSQQNRLTRHHKAEVYRLIEWAGRWGMIDVLLVAMVVAAVKLGDLVQVKPGPGVVAFAVCVLLSLTASAVFDPHAIWEQEPAPAIAKEA